MNILNRETDGNGIFFIEQENRNLAELTYELVGKDRLIIQHTYVSEDLSGKGIGKELVDKATEYARKKGLSVVPVCSFAKKIMTKDSSYQDVL